MNMIHEQVWHHQFGTGLITAQTETTVTVRFQESQKVKTFLYPDAFEAFLKASGPAVQGQIDGELRQIREKKEADCRKNQEEIAERRQEELRAKQTAAKKRTPVKKAAAKIKKVPKTPARSSGMEEGDTD